MKLDAVRSRLLMVDVWGFQIGRQTGHEVVLWLIDHLQAPLFIKAALVPSSALARSFLNRMPLFSFFVSRMTMLLMWLWVLNGAVAP